MHVYLHIYHILAMCMKNILNRCSKKYVQYIVRKMHKMAIPLQTVRYAHSNYRLYYIVWNIVGCVLL